MSNVIPDALTPENHYVRENCVVFRKTKDTWGGLSNMAAGYPLTIGGVRVSTSEALYQACRFPHRPDLQRRILAEKSPMAAKMVGKPYRAETRADWQDVRVDVMRWCLCVKLRQNWRSLAALLRSTGEREIVEDSHKDTFWGAKSAAGRPGILIGQNVLGRLLVEVRHEIVLGERTESMQLPPLAIKTFVLLGDDIPPL